MALPVPYTESNSVQDDNHVAMPYQDLIFLAYLPPLHISLTKLCIDNIRSEPFLKGTISTGNADHHTAWYVPLRCFDELQKHKKTKTHLTGSDNGLTIHMLDISSPHLECERHTNGHLLYVSKNGKSIRYEHINPNIRHGKVNYLKMLSPTEIGLSYFNDSTFSFISQLINLTDLVIYDSDIVSINLSNNKRLKNITLCTPKLVDLASITGLPNIEFIDVYETAVIDNDIFVTLPSLYKIITSHMASSSLPLLKKDIQVLLYDDPIGWFLK